MAITHKSNKYIVQHDKFRRDFERSRWGIYVGR
jgi:hypothetical protein